MIVLLAGSTFFGGCLMILRRMAVVDQERLRVQLDARATARRVERERAEADAAWDYDEMFLESIGARF